MEKSKLLIALVTCQAYQHRVAAQLATWIPIVRNAGYTIEIFDGPRLGVPDDYLSLPMKTQAICRYAIDHGYEKLMKIDDDGYVRVDKLVIPEGDYVGSRNAPNDYGWLGSPSIPAYPAGTNPFPYANGGCYYLSRNGMVCVDSAGITDWAEDRWVGNLLGREGYQLIEIPGYKSVGPCQIQQFLTGDTVVLMQIPNPEDMLVCHASKFDYVFTPQPSIIRPPVFVRRPRRRL